MNHKKLLKFFAAAVVLCLALTGQVFAASPTASAGVSVKGKVTSYLPGVGCTVQLVQGGEVKYSTVIHTNAGHAAQEFAIPGVASGIYDLVITKPGHLSYTVKDIVVQDSDIDLTSSSNEQIADITLVAGDINGDGCIDLQDVTIITSTANYGQKPVEIGYEGEPEDVTGLEDFIYETTAVSIRITGVKDPTKTEYIVPKNVTSIASGAFQGCTNLESITLPFVGEARDGTENTHFGYIFGANAYANNKSYVPASLKTVVITDAASIGQYAFYNCTSLTNIAIPNTVKTIGASAFYSCRNLTNVTIGKGVTIIGDSAFYNCTSLTSITIPNNVTSIGSSAFENCTNLTSITLPDSVTSLGNSAFSGCTSLTSITIPDSVTSIGWRTFSVCTSLTSITIPDSVTRIGGYAFSYCRSLTNITIPDSVINIGKEAFYGCAGLTSITIPDGVTSIGDSAFYNCDSLTSITIPDSVTSIGNYAFKDCTGLTSITYGGTQAQWKAIIKGADWDYGTGDYTITYEGEPAGLEDFYYEITEDGIKITGVKDKTKTEYFFPNTVTSIGKGTFEGCTNLTGITIPDSVTSIGGSAFYNCSSLTRVYITDIAAWCKISFGDYSSNPLYKGGNLYLNGVLVTNLVIPDGVTSIGERAFEGCSSLTSVTIPDSVTSIGDYVFYDCTSLTSITIPNSVTSIGNYAFNGCKNLTSITIPDGVTSIGQNAFSGCTSLSCVYITDMEKWCEISFSIFGTSNPLRNGGNLYLNGVLVTNLVIPDSITSIGNSAFDGCSCLTSVTIPDSVTSIGAYAFYGCSGLTSITIPDSVTNIGNYAFTWCSSLTSIKYGGTESQWTAITKVSGWNNYTGNYTITYNYTGE